MRYTSLLLAATPALSLSLGKHRPLLLRCVSHHHHINGHQLSIRYYGNTTPLTMIMDYSEGVDTVENLPNRPLVYKSPCKDVFPQRSSNWRDGLRDILSSVEEESEDNINPIVLFKNSKYVCVYDMVCFCFTCASAFHHLYYVYRHVSLTCSVLNVYITFAVPKSKVSFVINP